jgi:hypothetical protein
MKRQRPTPHELGYRFYRGYIYRRRPSGAMDLFNPLGQFICKLSLRDLPRYVDLSIKFGWEKPTTLPRSTRFEQLEMFKEAA